MTQGSSLRAYLLTRLVLSVPLVLILLTLVFVLLRVAPGDPITAVAGGRLTPQQITVRRHAAGLDRPLVAQYVDYVRNALTGNFGRAITDGRSVTSIIVDNGSATLELAIAAVFVAVVVGVSIGTLAGRFPATPVDIGGRLFATVVYATPVFFSGLLAQLLFGQVLGWLPTTGQAGPITQITLPVHTHLMVIDAIIAGDGSSLVDVVRHLILPSVTLGLILSAALIRLIRVNLLQSMSSDAVEASRARGLRERSVVFRYGLRNALVPVIAVFGLQFALLLSGTVLTEETFNWPGIGYELVSYLNNRDYPAVQGIVTFFALIVVVVSLLIDFVTAWVDPRVRY